MKNALIGIGVLFAALVAVSIITATPLVGEVVKLHTRGADGGWETTPLWIVDLGDAAYLRASTPEGSDWVARLRANPEVRLERAGKLSDVRVIEEPAQLQRVREEMAAKYGWADDFIALIGGDRGTSMAFRLQAIP